MSEIKITDGIGRQSVVLDGHDIGDAVRGFRYIGKAGDIPTVEIELVTMTADLDAEGARVTIPKETHDALIALGWTPPGGAE